MKNCELFFWLWPSWSNEFFFKNSADNNVYLEQFKIETTTIVMCVAMKNKMAAKLPGNGYKLQNISFYAQEIFDFCSESCVWSIDFLSNVDTLEISCCTDKYFTGKLCCYCYSSVLVQQFWRLQFSTIIVVGGTGGVVFYLLPILKVVMVFDCFHVVGLFLIDKTSRFYLRLL